MKTKIIMSTFVMCLLYSVTILSDVDIYLNSSISRPNYQSTSSDIRNSPQLTIYLYYEEGPKPPKEFAIIAFHDGKFSSTHITAPIENIKYTKFKAIFSLSNNFTQIKGFTSFPENISDSADAQTLARRVDLKVDPKTNILYFPTITKTFHPELNLALHAYYVLTHYLENTPIQPYSSSDGRSIPVNALQEYSIKVMDRDAISTCHYNPDRKDISVSNKWECSYYDSVYKHEYGHHLTYSVFKIPYTKYNPKYELFEPRDEQTALNEGFSVFLESRGTFNGLNDDFHNYYGINAGNDGANLYEKYKTDVRSSLLLRSGESVIGNISIALLQIDPTKNAEKRKFKNLL